MENRREWQRKSSTVSVSSSSWQRLQLYVAVSDFVWFCLILSWIWATLYLFPENDGPIFVETLDPLSFSQFCCRPPTYFSLIKDVLNIICLNEYLFWIFGHGKSVKSLLPIVLYLKVSSMSSSHCRLLRGRFFTEKTS